MFILDKTVIKLQLRLSRKTNKYTGFTARRSLQTVFIWTFINWHSLYPPSSSPLYHKDCLCILQLPFPTLVHGADSNVTSTSISGFCYQPHYCHYQGVTETGEGMSVCAFGEAWRKRGRKWEGREGETEKKFQQAERSSMHAQTERENVRAVPQCLAVQGRD